MSVWLVAENRVQLIRADTAISISAVPEESTGKISTDPVSQLPSYGRIRITAGTGAASDAVLCVVNSSGKAVKAIASLLAAIADAEQRLSQSPGNLFIHGERWKISLDPPWSKWPYG